MSYQLFHCLCLPYFNLDYTLTENASIIATSLPAKVRHVPLLYEETMEQGKHACACVKERVGGRDSSMAKLFPGQPRPNRKAHTQSKYTTTYYTYLHTWCKAERKDEWATKGRSGHQCECGGQIEGVHVSLLGSRRISMCECCSCILGVNVLVHHICSRGRM